MTIQREEDKSDPYESYRDENGRFVEGNPGNPDAEGRPRTWFSEDAMFERLGFLVSERPVCVCGCRCFRFKFDSGVLVARCNGCEDVYMFDAKFNNWRKDGFSF